jgi:hypothetical protein
MVPQVVAELVEPSTGRLAIMMGGVCMGSLSLYLGTRGKRTFPKPFLH